MDIPMYVTVKNPPSVKMRCLTIFLFFCFCLCAVIQQENKSNEDTAKDNGNAIQENTIPLIQEYKEIPKESHIDTKDEGFENDLEEEESESDLQKCQKMVCLLRQKRPFLFYTAGATGSIVAGIYLTFLVICANKVF